MDWAMLGAVGELVGAFAVVASLLYVGRQVQHNTAMARSAARHELSAEGNTWAMSIAQTPSLAEAFARVHRGETRADVSELERIQIGYAFVAYLNSLDLAFSEAQDGVIDQSELEGLAGPGAPLLRSPYMASLWPIVRPGLKEPFAEWMEGRYDLVSGAGQLPESWTTPVAGRTGDGDE
jgi:hypothetical protein